MKKILFCIAIVLCMVSVVSCQKKDNLADEHLHKARILMTAENGQKQNPEEAIKEFQCAVDLGSADAMWELGLKYEYGNAVEIDLDKAFQLYKQSADADNAIGYYLVGHCYQHGISVEEDAKLSYDNYKKSFDMLTEMAKDEDIYVLNFLGSAYFWGDGTERDMEEGFRQYMRAAELGSPECQYKVGYSYVTGEGAEKNIDEAIVWLTKSAKQGWPAAIELLNELSQPETNEE